VQLRWSERKQDVADVVMAIAIALEGQYEAWTAPLFPASGAASPHVVGPRAQLAASYLVVSLVLVARRRYPVGVLATMIAAAAVPVIASGTSQGFGQVLPFGLAIYTIGAHCPRRTSLRCLVALLAFIVLGQVLDPSVDKATDTLGALPFLILLLLLPWVAGMYIRTRRLYVAELRARAERAEAEREERARAAVAEEQARIARELHDAVAHAISVMVVQAEAAEEMLSRDPERARLPIQRIQSVGRSGLDEMRRLLGVLRRDESAALAPQPSLSGIGALADEIRAVGLPVDVAFDGVPRPLSTGIEISAYRIVQEALTNALKHARASRVAVRIAYGSRLELDVVDDGVGAGAPSTGGHGIVGMRERVALYGGTLDVGPMAGKGFRVRATFPLEAPA
jgi:signal transduction histidine kinase